MKDISWQSIQNDKEYQDAPLEVQKRIRELYKEQVSDPLFNRVAEIAKEKGIPEEEIAKSRLEFNSQYAPPEELELVGWGASDNQVLPRGFYNGSPVEKGMKVPLQESTPLRGAENGLNGEVSQGMVVTSPDGQRVVMGERKPMQMATPDVPVKPRGALEGEAPQYDPTLKTGRGRGRGGNPNATNMYVQEVPDLPAPNLLSNVQSPDQFNSMQPLHERTPEGMPLNVPAPGQPLNMAPTQEVPEKTDDSIAEATQPLNMVAPEVEPADPYYKDWEERKAWRKRPQIEYLTAGIQTPEVELPNGSKVPKEEFFDRFSDLGHRIIESRPSLGEALVGLANHRVSDQDRLRVDKARRELEPEVIETQPDLIHTPLRDRTPVDTESLGARTLYGLVSGGLTTTSGVVEATKQLFDMAEELSAKTPLAKDHFNARMHERVESEGAGVTPSLPAPERSPSIIASTLLSGAQELQAKDPTLYDHTMMGLGSSIGFIMMGLAARSATMGLQASNMLSNVAAALTSGGLESAVEAGSVWTEAFHAGIQKGMSQEEAAEAADGAFGTTFKGNVVGNAALNFFTFFDMLPNGGEKILAKILPKKLGPAVTEGIGKVVLDTPTGRVFKALLGATGVGITSGAGEVVQETMQGAISKLALDQHIAGTPYRQAFKDAFSQESIDTIAKEVALPSFLSSFILGGGASGIQLHNALVEADTLKRVSAFKEAVDGVQKTLNAAGGIAQEDAQEFMNGLMEYVAAFTEGKTRTPSEEFLAGYLQTPAGKKVLDAIVSKQIKLADDSKSAPEQVNGKPEPQKALPAGEKALALPAGSPVAKEASPIDVVLNADKPLVKSEGEAASHGEEQVANKDSLFGALVAYASDNETTKISLSDVEQIYPDTDLAPLLELLKNDKLVTVNKKKKTVTLTAKAKKIIEAQAKEEALAEGKGFDDSANEGAFIVEGDSVVSEPSGNIDSAILKLIESSEDGLSLEAVTEQLGGIVGESSVKEALQRIYVGGWIEQDADGVYFVDTEEDSDKMPEMAGRVDKAATPPVTQEKSDVQASMESAPKANDLQSAIRDISKKLVSTTGTEKSDQVYFYDLVPALEEKGYSKEQIFSALREMSRGKKPEILLYAEQRGEYRKQQKSRDNAMVIRDGDHYSRIERNYLRFAKPGVASGAKGVTGAPKMVETLDVLKAIREGQSERDGKGVAIDHIKAILNESGEFGKVTYQQVDSIYKSLKESGEVKGSKTQIKVTDSGLNALKGTHAMFRSDMANAQQQKEIEGGQLFPADAPQLYTTILDHSVVANTGAIEATVEGTMRAAQQVSLLVTGVAPSIKKALKAQLKKAGKSAADISKAMKALGGVYKDGSNVIQIEYRNDLVALSHEMGHAVANIVGANKGLLTDTEVNAILSMSDLAMENYTEESKAAEAAAVLISAALEGRVDIMNEFQKPLLKIFQAVESIPGLSKALEEFSAGVIKWRHSKPGEKLGAMSERKSDKTLNTFEDKTFYERARDKAAKIFHITYADMIDKAHPLDSLCRDLAALTGVDPNLYNIARVMPGKLHRAARDMESFMEIFKGIGAERAEILKRYAIAKRSLNYYNHGELQKDAILNQRVTDEKYEAMVEAAKAKGETPMTPEEFHDHVLSSLVDEDGKSIFEDFDPGKGVTKEEALELIEELDAADPRIKELHGKMIEFQRDLLERTLVATGMVSRETADYLKDVWPDYVPFIPAKNASNPNDIATGSHVTVRNQIKKTKGARDSRELLTIVDIFESISQNIARFHRTQQRNDFYKAAAKYAQEHGLGKLGDPTERGQKSDSTYQVWENGKVTTYGVDPEIGQIINKAIMPLLGSSDPTTAYAMKMLTGVSEFLKLQYTRYNPAFGVRNVVRDFFTTSVNTQAPLPPHYYAIKEYFKAFMGDEVARGRIEAAFNDGLLFSNLMAVGSKDWNKELKRSIGKEAAGETENVVLEAKRHGVTVLSPIEAIGAIMGGAGHNVISKMGKVMEFTEILPKLGELLYLEDHHSDKMTREHRIRVAREVNSDFQRWGRVGKNINGVSAFFNAAIQGSDLAVRNLTGANRLPGQSRAGRAAQTWGHVFLYQVLPAIAAWATINDDDEGRKIYDNIPKSILVKCIPFFVNGTMYAIPNSFDTSAISAATMMMLDAINGKNPFDAYAITEGMAELLPNLSFTALAPVLEVMMNKDFYTERPINQYWTNAMPWDVRNEGVPKICSTIAKILPGDMTANDVFHLFGGYLPAASAIGRMSDALLNPDSPAGIADLPVLRSFVLKYNAYGHHTIRLYEVRDKLKEAAGSANLNNRTFPLQAILDDSNSAAETIRKLYQAKKAIEERPIEGSFDIEAKRALIESYTDRIVKYAEAVNVRLAKRLRAMEKSESSRLYSKYAQGDMVLIENLISMLSPKK